MHVRVAQATKCTRTAGVVSAANRDLREMVEEGTFRADLYYRLNGFDLLLPPLRNRRDDIPALAEHFVRNHHMIKRFNLESD